MGMVVCVGMRGRSGEVWRGMWGCVVEVCVGVCRCVWSVGHAHSTVSITNAIYGRVFRWTSTIVCEYAWMEPAHTMGGPRRADVGRRLLSSGVERRDDDENMGDDRRRRDDGFEVRVCACVVMREPCTACV